MNNLFLIFGLGANEMIVVVLGMLLLFGGKKIPELARGLGKGIREFNNARANVETEIKEGLKDSERKQVNTEQ